MTTDAGMEERERIARIIDPLWWAEYDRRIALFDRIPMDDDVRQRAFEHERQFCEPSLAQADAILSLRSTPPNTAAPSGREDWIARFICARIHGNTWDRMAPHDIEKYRAWASEIASHDQRPIDPQDTQGERG